MEIKHLLKSQANQVFDAIRKNEFEPADFDWEDTQGPATGVSVSRLVHRASGFYFVFDNASGNFYAKWSPGEQTLEQRHDAGNWGSELICFVSWLNYLRRETESPNLWTEISKGARVLESAASADTSNALFTADEKKYVLSALDEIKQYLLTAHRLDPELVEGQLKYLAESSDRVGRRDWLNLLISVLVNIVINAALPPEATRELFRFAGTVLRRIINQPLLLNVST